MILVYMLCPSAYLKELFKTAADERGFELVSFSHIDGLTAERGSDNPAAIIYDVDYASDFASERARIKKRFPRAKLLPIGGPGSEEAIKSVLRAGGFAFIEKPCSLEDVREAFKLIEP